ncbi:hypothetical protein E1A91_D12G158600v1 [Gossypium mustelinum]|uniref:QWRF motif-containing protein 3 n=1 Tax=Gossypium mustelinum TaxID=34275 RepID=A0A5D2SF16_GOSMU|nr:hypothetical protein E1A91_D12G158600v1 [Gossypium mustelinum]
MNCATDPPKLRGSKSREVASRFLSPTSTPTHDSPLHSPNKPLSPLRRKSTSTDPRKHRSLEDPPSGLLGGLWPSSTTTTTTSSSSNPKKLDTLADFLGNERLKDFIERKSYEKRTNSVPFSLTKQTSHSEFSRFVENDKQISAKENHRPSVGGSMRYTSKLGFSRKSSSSSSSTSSSSSPNILPGRFSVDESALYKKTSSSQRKPDSMTDNSHVLDSHPEISDPCSASNNDSPAMAKTDSSLSDRKSGIEVCSKYLKDVPSRNRSRGTTWDSNNLNPVSADSSPKIKKFAIKNVIRRTNSHGAYPSQWALSPGRSGSPPMSVESKVKPMSFSSLKPPTSPSRTRGVEKFLNLGLMDLFKSRKSSPLQVCSGDVESVHHLRLIYNSLIQWRYANAKADAVNRNIHNQVQNDLSSGWNSLMKLQHSVVQKKLKLQKEKLEIKMDSILQSQMMALECWADMERQHLSAISMTKQWLHSVVCKVPLVEGAKVDAPSASMALRHAFDLTASIKTMLTVSSPGMVPQIEKTVSVVSELAEVVAQEKLLLEECLELFRMISILEIQERSLTCCIIELNSQQRQIQQQTA